MREQEAIKKREEIISTNVSDEFVLKISKWSNRYISKSDTEIIQYYIDIISWCNLTYSNYSTYPRERRKIILEAAAKEFSMSVSKLMMLLNNFEKFFLYKENVNPQIIVIEGIDGTGKTVQSNELYNYLINKGYKVKMLEFPVYDSFFGVEIGNLLSGKMEVDATMVDSKSMSLWYGLDRYDKFSEIEYDAYDYIILNRYTLSSAVYQTIRDGQNSNLYKWIFDLEHNKLKLPVPDIYIVLDLDVSKSQENVLEKGKRLYIENEKDVYEKSDDLLFMARDYYKKIAGEYPNIEIINCLDSVGKMQSINEIFTLILDRMQCHGFKL